MATKKDYEDFFNAMLTDKNFVAKMQIRADLDEFKETYNVNRATPLKCPACSSKGFSGGSLWWNEEEPKGLVCRKCRLVWAIECLTTPLSELIPKLREMLKG